MYFDCVCKFKHLFFASNWGDGCDCKRSWPYLCGSKVAEQTSWALLRVSFSLADTSLAGMGEKGSPMSLDAKFTVGGMLPCRCKRLSLNSLTSWKDSHMASCFEAFLCLRYPHMHVSKITKEIEEGQSRHPISKSTYCCSLESQPIPT